MSKEYTEREQNNTSLATDGSASFAQTHQERIIEAALLTAAEPLSESRLQALFEDEAQVLSLEAVQAALEALMLRYANRGVNLVRVATGYRFQTDVRYAPFLQKLYQKKPPRYSRALLETLALIIYRQPITRGDIEEVRGVAVSTQIIKTLQDRGWVKVVGQRDAPGKPALFGTTKALLDDFAFNTLSEFPPLDEIAQLDEMEKQFNEQLSLAISPVAPEIEAPIDEVALAAQPVEAE